MNPTTTVDIARISRTIGDQALTILSQQEAMEALQQQLAAANAKLAELSPPPSPPKPAEKSAPDQAA